MIPCEGVWLSLQGFKKDVKVIAIHQNWVFLYQLDTTKRVTFLKTEISVFQDI